MATVPAVDYATKQRERLAEYSRKKYAAAAEIGDIPPVQNPKRRRLCKRDLHLFLQAYFPHSTGLSPFGGAQTEVIARIEDSILHTGRILNCFPRGFCKSTMSERALLWALFYGHCRFGLIYAATEKLAQSAVKGIKSELFGNSLLAEDFPEICVPIHKTQGKPQRCASQTFRGIPTKIEWNADSVVLPTIPGSAASAAVFQSFGYTGATRGVRYTRTDGSVARPDLALIDDPQDKRSAKSPTQVQERLEILSSDILQTGGHGRSVSAVANATIICDGDMIDQLSDHTKHPEWQAVRVKMMPSMPTRLDDLWLDQYAKIRHNYDTEVVGDQRRAYKKATEFYEQNREEMDKGAEVSWHNIPLKEDEISAIQHGMNILIDHGEDTFASECQNEPRRQEAAGVQHMQEKEIRERYSGFARGVISDNTAHVVFHCDVHNAILYWSVAAVQQDFTGYIVDYGTYPQQPTNNFTMWSIKRTLQDELGIDDVEDAVAEGVRTVIDDLCGRDWIDPNGNIRAMSAGLVDVGYFPDSVAAAIRTSQYSSIIRGARGRGLGPTKRPMTDYDTSSKRVLAAGPDRSRPRWIIPKKTINTVPEVQFDTFWFKTLAAGRMMLPVSSAGAWSLFGNHRQDHNFYCSHLVAERPVPTTADGRTVTMWIERPGRENHFWDTYVGCLVAATLCGIHPPVMAQPQTKPKPKKSLSQKKRKRRAPQITRGDGRPFFVTAR